MKNIIHIFTILFFFQLNAQVGIGTTNPQAQLDVSGGSIRFSDYGSRTFTGTQAYLLGVESDGDVIELSANDLGVKGTQYYTWDISNTSSPNIDNIRTLGVPTTSGMFTGSLNDAGLNTIKPAEDGYIVLYKGTLVVNNTGNFTFNSNSDDGSRIYIDDVLILNDWIDQGPGSIASSTINLAEGSHRIEFWMYENGGGDYMNFTWGANPDGHTVNQTINALDLLIK